MIDDEVGVRRATALDAELLARVAAETFPGNFVGRPAPPSGMAAYIESSFSPEQQAAELAEPGSVFFIAQLGSDAIGYACIRQGPAPPEVLASPAAEIHRLYVFEDHWGSGAGRALMDACFEEAAARGSETVWLGAWSENPRALAFYRSLGFQEVGSQFFELGDETQVDLILERRLGQP